MIGTTACRDSPVRDPERAVRERLVFRRPRQPDRSARTGWARARNGADSGRGVARPPRAGRARQLRGSARAGERSPALALSSLSGRPGRSGVRPGGGPDDVGGRLRRRGSAGGRAPQSPARVSSTSWSSAAAGSPTARCRSADVPRRRIASTPAATAAWSPSSSSAGRTCSSSARTTSRAGSAAVAARVDQHVGQSGPGGPPARGPDQLGPRRGERRPGAGRRPQRGQHQRPGQPGQRDRVVQQRDGVADPHLERRIPGGGPDVEVDHPRVGHRPGRDQPVDHRVVLGGRAERQRRPGRRPARPQHAPVRGVAGVLAVEVRRATPRARAAPAATRRPAAAPPPPAPGRRPRPGSASRRPAAAGRARRSRRPSARTGVSGTAGRPGRARPAPSRPPPRRARRSRPRSAPPAAASPAAPAARPACRRRRWPPRPGTAAAPARPRGPARRPRRPPARRPRPAAGGAGRPGGTPPRRRS